LSVEMKPIFRLFLSLSFLLLCGQSNCFAHQYQDCTYHKPVSIPQRAVTTGFHSVLFNTTQITHIAPHTTEKQYDNIYLEETEDENREETSSKKYTTSSSYFTGYYPRLLYYFNNNIKERSFSAERFSYYASFRCTLFQVFRI